MYNNSPFVIAFRKTIGDVRRIVLNGVLSEGERSKEGRKIYRVRNDSRQSDTTRRIVGADISQLWPDKPRP